jgi:hypothetical protein
MMLARHKIPLPAQDATGSGPEKSVTSPAEASPEDATLERSLAGYFLGDEGPFEVDVPRITSNRSSMASVASASVYDGDSGVDAGTKPPTLITANTSSQLSIDHSSDNNTLVGEMQA